MVELRVFLICSPLGGGIWKKKPEVEGCSVFSYSLQLSPDRLNLLCGLSPEKESHFFDRIWQTRGRRVRQIKG